MDIEKLCNEYVSICNTLFEKFYCIKPITIKEETLGQRGYMLFDELKENLNAVRSQISTKERSIWRSHTAFTHPAKTFITESTRKLGFDMCSQAFFKLFDMLIRYGDGIFQRPLSFNESSDGDLGPRNSCQSVRSLHICEAPGAFISATNLFLQCFFPHFEWTWFGNSLNPYYEFSSPSELFLDDDLIIATLPHWLFGPSNSGNILEWSEEYLRGIVQQYGKFDFITADGSIYCQEDPSNQETKTLPLIEKEIRISLSLLKPGGSLILKMYTMFEVKTLETVLELYEHFEMLDFCKPICSKPGNSEVYLICRRFLDSSSTSHPTEIDYVRKRIYECAYDLYRHQTAMIRFNLNTVNISSAELMHSIQDQKTRLSSRIFAHLFGKVFNIEDDCCVPKKHFHFHSIRPYTKKVQNPWRRDRPKDYVERLRNMSVEHLESVIDSVVVKAYLARDHCSLLLGNVGWTDNGEERIVFGWPPPGTLWSVQNSLFVNAEVLAAAFEVKLDFDDFCEADVAINITSETEVEENLFGMDDSDRPQHSSSGDTNNLRTSHSLSQVHPNHRSEWIKHLQDIAQISPLRAVTLSSRSACLVLSRYSASVIRGFQWLFESVILLPLVGDGRDSHIFLTCSAPRSYTDRLHVAEYAFRSFDNAGSRPVLQFERLDEIASKQFYPAVHEYNDRTFAELFCRQRHTPS
ncbi:hypothetical protein AB6A40_002555 [Gnathostoma spinigerum]|uniref:Cap-specific mRNA (nucleoside-2'-O-)-methyltransferase 2 n=1 Tax=Gnathostoma spinigerum TaxID=75299 RepID=A0ABD6E899_9BILA